MWEIRSGIVVLKENCHKLDTRWLGKAVVTARESESSYVIDIRPGSKMKVHASFLKPWVKEEVVG